MRVRDIETRKHDSSKYVNLDFYINNYLKNDISITTYFKKEMHIINNLRVKLFIKNNIIDLEFIIFNIANRKLQIDSCEVNIFLFIKSRDYRVERVLRSKK